MNMHIYAKRDSQRSTTEMFNEIIENGSKVIESDVLCD